MKKMNPYLIYPGTCKDAFEFYRDCLGGDIELMQAFAESPIDVPEEHQSRIFNAMFRVDDVFIMASDDLPPDNIVVAGTNFSLFIILSTPDEQKTVFDKLSTSGNIIMPLQNKFGMFTDKYGIQWMVACE
jgi:PhnB protein